MIKLLDFHRVLAQVPAILHIDRCVQVIDGYIDVNVKTAGPVERVYFKGWAGVTAMPERLTQIAEVLTFMLMGARTYAVSVERCEVIDQDLTACVDEPPWRRCDSPGALIRETSSPGYPRIRAVCIAHGLDPEFASGGAPAAR